MKRNSGFIGGLQSTTSSTAPGIHDLHDVHLARSRTAWPRTAGFALNASTTNVTEGSSITFTLSTEHVANNTTFYYTISTVSGTTMVDADFNVSPGSGGVDGSFTTTNNSTSLVFGLVAEQSPGVTENNVFKLQIREGSTSGTIIIESAEITVTDAVQIGEDLRNSFYEISNRYIVDNTTQDYTGNWDVGEVQQAYSGSARVYLVFKNTTSTTYFNDICVAAVQILNSSNVAQQTWNFSNGTQSWETVTSRSSANSALLSSYYTPSDAASLSYTTSFSNNISRVGWTTQTGSHYTGMANGIDASDTSYTVGNGQVPQYNNVYNAYYIYAEVSGSTRYTYVIARSPSFAFTAGDKIKVVHAVVIPNSMTGTININDSLWIGIY